MKSSEVTLTVDPKPTNTPEWNETIIIDLTNIQNSTHIHFLVSFFPTSKSWASQLHSFLKIDSEDGFVSDGLYRLKCFSRPPNPAAATDPVFYLKDWKGEISFLIFNIIVLLKLRCHSFILSEISKDF